MKNKRRDFIKQSVALGAAIFTPALMNADDLQQQAQLEKPGDGFTFLFQGDSITDGNRTRNDDWNHVMGHGYACNVASRLWYDLPERRFHFFNRGISGNKVPDLMARWQKDTLDLKPDVLSILIGINDTTVSVFGDSDFTVEKFENEYRALLQQTKLQLPQVQFVLCEPFILPVGNRVNEKWAAYAQGVQKRSEVVRRLSGEFNAIFVGFQQAFDRALAKAPADYWIWDGIHPMPAGHELMAREWIKTVRKRLSFI